MVLVPCRECRKSISTEAKACPHCGVPNPAVVRRRPRATQSSKPERGTTQAPVPKGIGPWTIGAAVVFIGIPLLVAISRTLSEPRRSFVGHEGGIAAAAESSRVRVYVPGADWVYLASDRASMNDLLDAQNASDVDGVRRLGQQGKVFRVPNNTDAEVVDRSATLAKVRIIEEGQVAFGREGWVQREFAQAWAPPDTEATDLVPPEYRVLDKFGNQLEVLIPSLSVTTPRSELAAIGEAIAAREGVTEVYLYRTEEARRANFSASYSEQHPEALSEGYLGKWNNGRFEPGLF